MKNIDNEQTLEAVKNHICPNCYRGQLDSEGAPFFTEERNMIRVNSNLIYCQCSNCDRAFKFMRRTIYHKNDSTGWEYILVDREKLYGIRGYYISMKTYKKNFYQYQFRKNYYQYGHNEIDDVFKEILGDRKEGIYSFVGKAFQDDEHLRNGTRLVNWHNEENTDPLYLLDDDDLLAELDRL